MKISEAYQLSRSQAELDFADVELQTDNPLFVDPFALSIRRDDFSYRCHRSLMAFFQRVIDEIRAGRPDDAYQMLLHLSEPNETRLGYSRQRPQGAGIGWQQASEILEALKGSAAVQTGFLTSLEDCELMIEGISRDKISDLTTNVIRAHLIRYTQDQAALHGIPTQNVALPPVLDEPSMTWQSQYAHVPVWQNSPLVLVPKAFVRYQPAYDAHKYYRHYVLEFLKAEELKAGSSLVRALKRGGSRVLKKDVADKYPYSKDFLYTFSKEHPDVLKQYRSDLERLERAGQVSDIDDSAKESSIAAALSQALKSIPAGAADASTYHALMIGVVEFLFYPHLLYPKKEQEIHDGRKRIDIAMENGASEGIFFSLPNVKQLPCAYVFFECKNYRTDVANPATSPRLE